MDDLTHNGYVVLKNKLTESEIEYGLSSIKGTQVDYHKTKQFIDEIFFTKIKETGMTNPQYVKFRLSNNNNSTDASTFHGDIYNHTQTELLPIYTCLCYFDDAQLEIIPGSHKYNNAGSSMDTYHKKKIIDVQRGDILIFHANTHHRGINFNKTSNRRLLQVFEVFTDKETYNAHIQKLIIVKTSDSMFMKYIINPVMYELSNFPIIIDTLTMFHYVLMYNDLQYKIAFMDISPEDKKNNYVTYEPGKRIMFDNVNKTEELNINIICDPNATTVSYSNYYLLFYILYWIISLICIYLFYKLWFIVKKPKSKSRKTQGVSMNKNLKSMK